MKLIDALRIANEPQHGPEYHVLLACGFTPLHLETAVRARLHLALPDKTIRVHTGLFGDLAGTLENPQRRFDGVLIALEWADVDPRLGWRSMGRALNGIVEDAGVMARRIERAIDAIARTATGSALALPSLPFAPVFHTAATEMNHIQASLWELVYSLAASTSATIVQMPKENPLSVHDLRSELMTGFPYSFEHADALGAAFTMALFPQGCKKGLITDLDETLWSGVLGDDGPEGLSWDLDHGTHFFALYQHLLNSLAERGALIAVASKNDPELVREALQRPGLAVRPEILFPVEANWNSKTASIARILRAWNIGEDSVVFVDDNDFELEQVRQAFPAMDCRLFRRDDAGFLLNLNNSFAKRRILDEDALRSSSLRGAQTFTDLSAGTSLDEILAGAQAKIVASWMKNPSDERALDLINKTNQFNLNGIRYTKAEWQEFLRDPSTKVLVVEYEDRFGKLGKIAVMAGRSQDGKFRITTWVMSCRAFSRRIEHQCLSLLLHRWEQASFEYKLTERNAPIRDFLEKAGINGGVTRSAFERYCPPLFHSTEVRIDE